MFLYSNIIPDQTTRSSLHGDLWIQGILALSKCRGTSRTTCNNSIRGVSGDPNILQNLCPGIDFFQDLKKKKPGSEGMYTNILLSTKVVIEHYVCNLTTRNVPKIKYILVHIYFLEYKMSDTASS
jgi:hypothetical protein